MIIDPSTVSVAPSVPSPIQVDALLSIELRRFVMLIDSFSGQRSQKNEVTMNSIIVVATIKSSSRDLLSL